MRVAPRRGRPGPAVFARPHLRRAPARVTSLPAAASGGPRSAGIVAAAALGRPVRALVRRPASRSDVLRIPPVVLALVAPRRRPRVDRRAARAAPGDGGAPASPWKLALAVALAFAFRLPWPGTGSGLRHRGRRPLRHRRPADPRRPRAPRVRAARSVQRQPEVAPGRGARPRRRPARAFALVSVLFYCAVRGRRVPPRGAGVAALRPRPRRRRSTSAFAPAFVTRYSLSNDGNYVEVLALGSAALAGARGAGTQDRARLDPAVDRRAAAGPRVLVPHPGRDPRPPPRSCSSSARAVRAAARAAPARGWVRVSADVPGLLWNAANGGESFRYLLPGGPRGDRGGRDASHQRAWAAADRPCRRAGGLRPWL